jgi:hypothetical protein
MAAPKRDSTRNSRENRQALDDAEARIFEHPAYKAYENYTLLRRDLDSVLLPNLAELLAPLDRAANDPQLAIELIQNTHTPLVRERFIAEVTQRLHNYLASVATVVEHSRRIMRGRTDDIDVEFRRRLEMMLKSGEHYFMIDLRNMTMHYGLPGFTHHLNISMPNGGRSTHGKRGPPKCFRPIDLA